jgi:hypothetical protein
MLRPSILALLLPVALVGCGSPKVPEDGPDQGEVVSTGTTRRVDLELACGVTSDSGLLELVRPSMRNFDQDPATPEVGFGFALTNPFPLRVKIGYPVKVGEGIEPEVFSFRLDFR